MTNQITKTDEQTKVIEIINRSTLLGREIDVYGSINEPLFLAKDVALWIEHSNARMMLASVDEDEKGVRIAYTPGGNQETWFLTENGLYEVLMLSRKPIAKQFKKGVKEILRTIRKTGQYNSFQVPKTFAQALMLAAKQQEQLELQQAEIDKKQKQLEEQKPKVKLAEVITANEQCYPLKELATLLAQRGVKIGSNRLRHYLRDNHYLGTRGVFNNLPCQRYVEQGLFIVTETPYTDKFGYTHINSTVHVTGKGLEYFVNKLYKETKIDENSVALKN